MALVKTADAARLLGVSHTAIAKAVKADRVKVAARDEKGRPLFDDETLVSQWSSNSNPAKLRDHKLGGRPRKDGEPTRQHQPEVIPTTAPHHPDRPMAHGGALQTGGHLRGPREPDGPPGGGTGPTYNEAAAKEKHYKAELARLDYEQKIGALVPIANVAAEVEKEYSRVRARLLAIASKLAPEVALSDDVGECRRIIGDAVNDALNELTADTAANGDAEHA